MSSSGLPVDTTATTSSFTPDAGALGQGIDVATVVAAVAAANQMSTQAPVQPPSAEQQQQQQATQAASGLTMMNIHSGQMTSAMLQSIGHTPSTGGTHDLFMGVAPQPLLQTTLTSSQATIVTAPQQLSMVNGHSRSTSVIDGAVSMFPTDGSSTGTPRSGMVASAVASGMTQPMVAQIKQQLQQHQQTQLQFQLQTQTIHNGISTGASTAASANHSGVPSPLLYGASAPMHMGHRRQMSSTLPSAAYQPQQQQQQQQMLYVDTPMSVATAPPTLVPGTPVTFGQLQFPPQQQASAAAPTFQGLQTHHSHHAHPHLGHSRHLSLDTANLRLMSTDISSLHTQQPLQGAFHERQTHHVHQTEMAQQAALQYGSSNSFALAQQLQFHSQIQQLQAQDKLQPQPQTQPMMIRTMPVTPQHPTAGSFAGSFQAAPMSDPMIQQQTRQRHAYMHHSSCSVDLGSLSSAFNASQFNQALSGQISPMAVNPAATTLNPGDLSPMNFASSLGHSLFANDTAPTQPLKLSSSHATLYGDSGIATEAVSGDDLYDDDDMDDDTDGVVGSSSANNASSASKSKSQPKGASSKSTNASGNTTPKAKKTYAPYKRFRNSFIFFANAKREQWKLEHPEVSKIQNRGFIQDMSKVWNNMSPEDKAPFIKMANDDKARYEADVKKYGPLPSSSVSSSAASISSTAGLVTASAPVSATVPNDASASATSASKSKKKKDATSAEIAARLSEAVPIAPAPVPSSISAPVSAPVTAMGSDVDLSSLGVDPNATTVSTFAAAATNTGSGDASAPANSVVPIAPAPFVPIAAKPANGCGPSLAPAATTQQSVSIAQPAPIVPAIVGSNLLMPMTNIVSGDSNNIDNMIVANRAYQTWLQHALGQDFSPQAIEFDPSCFVAPDPVAADEGIYLNPQSLTSSTEDTLYQSMPAPFEGDALEANSSGSTSKAPSVSGSVSSNGPMITTLVGTKRKSSIDGLPVTSLPMSVKRFRNSFIYFVDEKRREAQQGSDGSSIGAEINNREFLKEMSAMWRVLSDEEKSPYVRMADADKERFTRQMREYELEHPDEFAKISRHKRRRSSTGASNVSTVNIPADIIAAAKSLEQQQQQQQQIPVSDATPAGVFGGLNISLLGGSSIPLSQTIATCLAASCAPLSADASQAQQIIQQQIMSLTTTPMSTTHNTPHATPLLSPNVSIDKSEALAAAMHFPSLPSVPEDMVICSEAFVAGSSITNVGSGAAMHLVASGSLGLNEYDGSAILSTLPTLTEAVDEDIHMD
ncbi:hypothetical protein LPJ53_000217 [Coemansia erecta]|uniref:HMG box domain-containing protein n=1 Tax=Coemansia erecta TaxID=147472 RepID=A0A9W8CW46_9FUNG|nr:hypothetical protein LPJ53_000217 [Coemansia erecta]